MHQTVLLQRSVGPGDGIEVDPQVIGQLPHGGQLGPRAQLSAGDRGPQLAYELLGQGLVGVHSQGQHEGKVA